MHFLSTSLRVLIENRAEKCLFCLKKLDIILISLYLSKPPGVILDFNLMENLENLAYLSALFYLTLATTIKLYMEVHKCIGAKVYMCTV